MRDNRKRKMRLRLIAVIVLGIVIISATLGCVYFTHNKGKKQVIAEKLEKNEMTENGIEGNANSENNTQALDEEEDITANWDLNKVDVYTDPYGNKAPIPKGFTVSGVASERYIETEGEKPTRTEKQLVKRPIMLTFTSTGDYPWTQNEDGVWQSGNYHIPSSKSSMESNEFILDMGGTITVINAVSSESSSTDYLKIYLIDIGTGRSTRIVNTGGTIAGTLYENLIYNTSMLDVKAGTYKLSIEYIKNGTTDKGLDGGYIKAGIVGEYCIEETETPINGGLVIYEGEVNAENENAWTTEEAWNASINNNQFVWVPVVNTSRIYETNSTTKKIKAKLWDFTATGIKSRNNSNTDKKFEVGILDHDQCDTINYFNRYNIDNGGYTKDSFYKELEVEYKNTIASIEKYGGFYIGRYETGDISSNIPVVRRMNTDISNQTWYTMYSRMRNISSNSNIQTNMIWGSLWDETLQWLIGKGEKTQEEIAESSSSWGNYLDCKFIYYNSNGELINIKLYTGLIPSGSAEYTKANNIYDLAGNVTEWGMECDSWKYRYLRGGDCFSSSVSLNTCSGRTSNSPEKKGIWWGARAYFYIK